MISVARSAWHARFAAAAVSSLPAIAWSHAFDERYDLPAPLPYFVAGATTAVALSFVVAVMFIRYAPSTVPTEGVAIRSGPVLPALRTACGILSVILLAITITAGLFGTRDPMMNLAPTLVWVVFWVGLSLLVACIGNVWPALDPWHTVFGWLNALARRLGRKNGIVLGLGYPRSIGAWPAVVLLLGVGWLEVVYPEGAEPHRMAQVILVWSAFTLLGSVCFGRDQWQRHADVFALYFAMLGRFAPIAPGRDPRSLVLRPPGRGLLATNADSIAMVGFIIAMLATVLFDGLLSGQAWWAAQAKLTRAMPLLADSRGYVIGTLGLVSVWLLLLGGFLLSCWIAVLLVPDRSPKALVFALACTLVPIAIAYNIAHNCSNLLVQGQQVIPLLSDPFGMRWDLFGTAAYRANIGIVDARTTWYVAIGAIVAGHVISIWLAHRVALREFGTPRKAVIASVPLTVLMLAYTALSLSVIAEPMVKFDEPNDSAMSRCAHPVRDPPSSSAWCTRSGSIGCCLSRTPVS
jgi:hypothetical protein